MPLEVGTLFTRLSFRSCINVLVIVSESFLAMREVDGSSKNLGYEFACSLSVIKIPVPSVLYVFVFGAHSNL